MFLASLKLMPCYYQVDIVGKTPFNQVFPVIRWLAVAWGLTCCYNNYCIIIHFQYPCDYGEIPLSALSPSHLIGGRIIVHCHYRLLNMSVWYNQREGWGLGICKLNVASVANYWGTSSSTARQLKGSCAISTPPQPAFIPERMHMPSPITNAPRTMHAAPGLTLFYLVKHLQSGKVHHVHMCACNRGIPHLPRSMWAENISNVWLPYTNIRNFKVP